MYRIGQVARISGVNPKTLRRYEARGLLTPVRRSGGGFRLYDDSSLNHVRFIQSARGLGFSLSEIQHVMRAREGGASPCVAARRLLERKLIRNRECLADLEAIEVELASRLAWVETQLRNGHPQTIEDQSERSGIRVLHVDLAIDGMTCSHCGTAVERALELVDGVSLVRVNYGSKEVEVHGDAETQVLVDAIARAGFQATPLDATPDDGPPPAEVTSTG